MSDKPAGGPGLSTGVLLALFLFVAHLLPGQQFVDQTGMRFPTPDPLDYSSQVALADIDDDGDLDVAFANGRGFGNPQGTEKVRVLLNNDVGVFADETDQRTGGLASYGRDVEFGDLDGDHDLDMVVANDFNTLPRLLINLGGGFFSDETPRRLPAITLGSPHVALGDVDNDGDLDLWFANGGLSRFGAGQPQLWVNDGHGFFTDATARRLPAQLTPQPMDAIFGDLDGDFDLDLVEAHLGSGNSRLFRNDGTGTFSDISASHFAADSSCYSYDLGDLDGDGDLDLVGANGSPSGVREILLTNNGEASFTDETNELLPLSDNPNVDDNDSKFFDYDGDGDLDMIIASLSSSERIYENVGMGHFELTSGLISAVADSSLDIEVGDLDGDGRLDVVTAQGESGSFVNRVYMNVTGVPDTRAPTFPDLEVLEDTLDARGPYAVRVTILDDMTSDNSFHRQSTVLSYSVDGGSREEIELRHMGGDQFRAEIPGQPGGSVITYQAHAKDLAGNAGSSAELSFRVLAALFVRGDVDNDGEVMPLNDSLFLLRWGFVPGSPGPPCEDAADVNDDGELGTLEDALFLLLYGFLPGTPPPPAPFPACGTDASDDALRCSGRSPGCP